MWEFADPILFGLASLLFLWLVIRHLRHEDAPTPTQGVRLAESGYVVRLRPASRRRRFSFRLERFTIVSVIAIVLAGLVVGILYGLSVFSGYKDFGYAPRDIERWNYEQKQ